MTGLLLIGSTRPEPGEDAGLVIESDALPEPIRVDPKWMLELTIRDLPVARYKIHHPHYDGSFTRWRSIMPGNQIRVIGRFSTGEARACLCFAWEPPTSRFSDTASDARVLGRAPIIRRF